MNSSRWSSARWRLDEQAPVDEQSQVEAGGGRRWMNSSPWRLEEVDCGDEQYPVASCFAVCHTPPDEQDPVSTVVLQHKSVSFVLRYATPLPINRTPFRPQEVQQKSVSSILPYSRPSRLIGSVFERGRSNTRPFPLFYGTPGLISITCSIQALPMNTTTHSVPTQPVGSP